MHRLSPYTIKVRDLRTKLAVHAKIQFEGPGSVSMETDGTGKLNVALPPGKYDEAISAPGYKTMKVSITIRPGGMPESIVMLEPIKKAEDQTYRELEAQLRPGYTLVEGTALDEDGQPVADVKVRLEGKSIATTETTTGSKGIYSFLIPTPPTTPIGPADSIPGTGTVIAEKPAYKTLVHDGVPLSDNSYWDVLLQMERGSGTLRFDDMPVPMRGDDAIHDDEDDNAKPQEPAGGTLRLNQKR